MGIWTLVVSISGQSASSPGKAVSTLRYASQNTGLDASVARKIHFFSLKLHILFDRVEKVSLVSFFHPVKLAPANNKGRFLSCLPAYQRKQAFLVYKEV